MNKSSDHHRASVRRPDVVGDPGYAFTMVPPFARTTKRVASIIQLGFGVEVKDPTTTSRARGVAQGYQRAELGALPVRRPEHAGVANQVSARWRDGTLRRACTSALCVS